MKGDIFRTFLALTLTVLNSCIQEVNVTDHSFDFSGVVVYDHEADQHRLTLTCAKNSGADNYNIAFSLDGENVITLTDMEGRTHQDSFKESFTDTDSHTYILSETAVGSHLLQLTISTKTATSAKASSTVRICLNARRVR
mgnify:CR=1 FL=1